MAQLRWCCGNHVVWMFLLALLQSGTTSTLPWEPRFVDVDPVSPVIYNFEGNNDRICISLSPSVTVVVTVTIVDPSLSYWVDRLPHVDINLVQTRRTCYRDAGEMCLLLVLTTTSSNLTEGIFNIFYNNVATKLAYGPIGFSDPSGSISHVVLFRNNTAMLLYRQTVHESTANADTRTSVAFRVCSNGEVAHFDAPAFPLLTDCRLGTGAGGYSVPYAVNLVYAGSHTIHGQHFMIVSSENCTSFSSSYHFIAFDAALIATTTTPPAPITSPSPPSAIPRTLSAATSSTNTTTVIAIAIPCVAVALAMIAIAVITVGWVCYHRKKRKYNLNGGGGTLPGPRPGQDHRAIPKTTNRTEQEEPDHSFPGPSSVGGVSMIKPEIIDTEHHRGQDDTLPRTSSTSTSPPHPSASLTQIPANSLQHPNTVPVVRRENSITESTATTSMARMNQVCQSYPCCQQPRPCCQQNVAVGLNYLNQSVDTLRQNQEIILSNQGTIISNQEQHDLVEQDINPELTESGAEEI